MNRLNKRNNIIANVLDNVEKLPEIKELIHNVKAASGVTAALEEALAHIVKMHGIIEGLIEFSTAVEPCCDKAPTIVGEYTRQLRTASVEVTTAKGLIEEAPTAPLAVNVDRLLLLAGHQIFVDVHKHLLGRGEYLHSIYAALAALPIDALEELLDTLEPYEDSPAAYQFIMAIRVAIEGPDRVIARADETLTEMNSKYCTGCRQRLDLGAFYMKKDRADKNKRSWLSKCKACVGRANSYHSRIAIPPGVPYVPTRAQADHVGRVMVIAKTLPPGREIEICDFSGPAPTMAGAVVESGDCVCSAAHDEQAATQCRGRDLGHVMLNIPHSLVGSLSATAATVSHKEYMRLLDALPAPDNVVWRPKGPAVRYSKRLRDLAYFYPAYLLEFAKVAGRVASSFLHKQSTMHTMSYACGHRAPRAITHNIEGTPWRNVGVL